MKRITTKHNPFTPSFGSIPVTFAGRQELINDILGGLENAPGDPNRATIFVGARGTGKTALLAAIAEEAGAIGWLSVNVTSGNGMLEEVLVQIRDKASHLLKPQTLTKLSGIQVAGLGVTVEHSRQKSTWRSQMTSLIKELNNRQTGLLITVDEISPHHEELRLLVNVYQHFVRERLDVAILLAGLPSNVSLLLRDDDISFLRRAFQHPLSAISFNEVSYAIKHTVENSGRSIAPAALQTASEGTGGYAFLIQLVGYHMWRQHENDAQISLADAEEGLTYAARDMERMIFDSLIKELSAREREFLAAMTEDTNVSEISEIAARMGVAPNNASQIKRRLLEQGVIGESGRGQVAFEIPFFREYLLKAG